MIDYDTRLYFAEYTKRQLIEREIRPWYAAYYAETSEAFLRSCLKRKKLPRLTSLIMLAELFECTLNELLGYKYCDVDARDHLFDTGLESKNVFAYFAAQLDARNFDSDDVNYDDDDMRENFMRALRLGRLPETDVFLKICKSLNCTPSELLGY